MSRYRTVFTAGLPILVVVGLLAYLFFAPAGLKRAPEVSLSTVEGETLSMAELRGRPVLVTFWATDCSTCMKEMPHLVELYKDLGPKGLEIVGVAMPYDDAARVRTMVRERPIPYPIALDPNGEITQAFGGINVTPTTFLIAPDGRIVQQRLGLLDMARVRQRVADMLARS